MRTTDCSVSEKRLIDPVHCSQTFNEERKNDFVEYDKSSQDESILETVSDSKLVDAISDVDSFNVGVADERNVSSLSPRSSLNTECGKTALQKDCVYSDDDSFFYWHCIFYWLPQTYYCHC